MVCCWICGGRTTNPSKEHLIKASDLKQAFQRQITQKNPLYLHHKGGRSNVHIASIPKNKRLKSTAPICCKCNNERTQIHDRSWAMLSRYLMRRYKCNPKKVQLDDVFRGTACSIGGVQLFFAKNLGCRIIGSKAPFDVAPLSQSIFNNKICDSLYLSIGFAGRENNFVGATQLQHCTVGNHTMFFQYIYGAGNTCVKVIYSIKEPKDIPISFNPNRESEYLELTDWK